MKKFLAGVSWTGWLATSLLVSMVLLLSWHTLTSIFQDIGRHLTIGEIIWKTKHVPGTNLFSYTAPDFPFINHHWLGELFLYLGEQFVGLKGLIALKAVMLTGAFTLAFSAAWKKQIVVPALVVGLVSVLIISERTDLRPEILSFLFLGWYLFVLYRNQKLETGNWMLWSLPCTQLLWVNTHIYFFMGAFLWLAYLIGELAKRNGKLEIGNWRNGGTIGALKALVTNSYIQISVAITIATLANPWFIRGAFYPFRILGNYGYSIVENQSYFFLRAFGYPGATFTALIIGLLIYLVSLILNRSRIRENIFGVITVAGAFALSMVMIRNFPLFGFIVMPATLHNLAQPPIRWTTRGTGIGAILLFLLGASIVQGQFYGRLSLGSKTFGLVVPEGHQKAVNFFREHQLQGPIFNNFDIGSYLIWKLPEERVFIDGRPEAYPAEFLQDTYIRAQEQEEVWQRVLAQYHINVIFWNTRDITPWSRTFLGRIQDDSAWRLVYFENAIALFVRTPGLHDALPDLRSEVR